MSQILSLRLIHAMHALTSILTIFDNITRYVPNSHNDEL